MQYPNMYPVDLKKGPAIVRLNEMFLGDALANRIGAIVTNDGEAVSLSGTCSGTAILANGGTVAITGTVSGNTCYVNLPSAVYAVEGPVEVFVTNVSGGETITLIAAFGNVRRTQTGSVIDPGTIISSVSALIDAIDTAVASIPADYSALSAQALCMKPTNVLPGTYTALLSDLDNADDNKLYYVAMFAFSISSIPANIPYGIAVEPALLLTASTTSGSSYKTQLWITKTGIMTRLYVSGAGWQPWTVIKRQTVTVSTASQLIRVVESGLPCNILLGANIELYAGYKAEKGNDYWENYTGYSQTGDRNDSGLYLHPHVSFNGQQHVISFNPTTKTQAMMRDFSPFNLGGDNVLENVIIDIGNRNCRYAIHDDFAIATEGEIIRNVTMIGTGTSPALLGAGVKPYCSYVVENCLCLDNAGDCDILYHSSTQNVQAASFLAIRNCYCEKDINIKYTGTNQVITPCLVTGCHARAITLSAGSGETPYQNMNLVTWNNETGV